MKTQVTDSTEARDTDGHGSIGVFVWHAVAASCPEAGRERGPWSEGDSVDENRRIVTRCAALLQAVSLASWRHFVPPPQGNSAAVSLLQHPERF